MAKFLIRSIAKLNDATGMYRVRVLQVSERIQTMADAETLVFFKSEQRQGFPVEILEVDDEEYARAEGGKMCGYAVASDLKATWVPMAWEPLV